MIAFASVLRMEAFAWTRRRCGRGNRWRVRLRCRARANRGRRLLWRRPYTRRKDGQVFVRVAEPMKTDAAAQALRWPKALLGCPTLLLLPFIEP